MNRSFYTDLLPILLLVFLICIISHYNGRSHVRRVMQKYNFDKTTASVFIRRNLALVTKYRRMTKEMSIDSPDIEARLKHLEDSYQDEIDALVEELRSTNVSPDSE